ncbi:MAG: CPBP family glutamic-type intramembrane protease [Chloroflexota bacterium]
MPSPKYIYYSAVALPYITVAIGLYLLNNAWIAMLGYHLGMALLLTTQARNHPLQKRKDVGSVWYWIGFSLIGSLLSGVLVYALWPWLAKFPASDVASFLSGWSLGPSSWAIFVVYFCLMNPWLEEIYWRRWLSQTDHSELETSGWFAGYHGLVLIPIIQGWAVVIALIILFFVGWWWARMVKLSGSLFGPIVCHFVANVSIMLAVNWLYSLECI